MIYGGGDIALLTEVQRELLMLCQDFQGAMEYCHGVGIRLASLMDRGWNYCAVSNIASIRRVS